jgi:transcriptional regulator with GAF, ATPase, and Fis domain
MKATFGFLTRTFPLEGLSLHRFDLVKKEMHMLFLVTREGFYYLDLRISLPDEGIKTIREGERTEKIVSIPSSFDRSIPGQHAKALDVYLPNKDRARLVAILSTPKKVVGHFSMIGKGVKCYTPEHERKLTVLWPVLNLFMVNLLQYHEISKLKNRLANQNRYLTRRLRHLSQHNLVGEEGGLRFVKEIITQLSGLDVPVLISGETGTGKELIADAIQNTSSRHKASYIKVNCGAIPDSLIDSELFGHEKGAFTGADRKRPGRFEQAHGGTLFLDEVGDMPLNAQTRLLRVLQDGIFERIGGSKPIYVDVRIIAATHQDLPALVEAGKFRKDLYYRLNVLPIKVPPLRERTQDIPALIHHFIKKKAGRLKLSETPLLAQGALPVLMGHLWPGNVRELENLVERALVMDPKGPLKLNYYLLDKEGQPFMDRGPVDDNKPIGEVKVETNSMENRLLPLNQDMPGSVTSLRENMPSLDQVMTEHIRRALELCNDRISGPKGAAKMIGINPNTLRTRMDKLGIPYGRKEG